MLLTYINGRKYPVVLIDRQEREFTAMVHRTDRIVRRICVLFSDRSAEGMRDLYQEIVCEMWRSFHRFRRASSETTWVYRVALNTALRQHRSRKRQPILVPLECQGFDTMAVDNGDAGNDLTERLYLLIEQLPPDERALAYMYTDNVPMREIAAVLDTSENAVKLRIRRIKEKLKKLNDEYQEQ